MARFCSACGGRLSEDGACPEGHVRGLGAAAPVEPPTVLSAAAAPDRPTPAGGGRPAELVVIAVLLTGAGAWLLWIFGRPVPDLVRGLIDLSGLDAAQTAIVLLLGMAALVVTLIGVSIAVGVLAAAQRLWVADRVGRGLVVVLAVLTAAALLGDGAISAADLATCAALVVVVVTLFVSPRIERFLTGPDSVQRDAPSDVVLAQVLLWVWAAFLVVLGGLSLAALVLVLASYDGLDGSTVPFELARASMYVVAGVLSAVTAVALRHRGGAVLPLAWILAVVGVVLFLWQAVPDAQVAGLLGLGVVVAALLTLSAPTRAYLAGTDVVSPAPATTILAVLGVAALIGLLVLGVARPGLVPMPGTQSASATSAEWASDDDREESTRETSDPVGADESAQQSSEGDAAADAAVPAPSTPAIAPGEPVTVVPDDAPVAGAVPGGGDLGLAQPIANLDCDGGFVTMVAAAVNPDSYEDEVAALLAKYPGSRYLRTDQSCAIMAPTTTAGDAIYQVYYGPYSNSTDACQGRYAAPGGAYVKWFDPSQDRRAWLCMCDRPVSELPTLSRDLSYPAPDKQTEVAVSELERMLARLDYDAGTIDGQFQKRTTRAVTRFQEDEGLFADGVVGPSTWQRMVDLGCP